MRVLRSPLSLLAVLVVLLLPCEYSSAGARTLAPQLQASNALFDLMGDRVTLMHAVALDKYLRRLPIEDKQREAVVIRAAREQAALAGVGNIEPLIRAQIEIAKAEQRRWFLKWDKHGLESHPATVDLAKTRREIDKLTRTLVPALVEALPALQDAAWRPSLKRNFDQRLNRVPSQERDVLWRALLGVRPAASSSKFAPPPVTRSESISGRRHAPALMRQKSTSK